MKRILLTLTATVIGVVALLSFKTQTHPLTTAGSLPSAGVVSSGGAGSSASTSGVTTGAPPDPSPTGRSTSSSSGASTRAASYVGSAVTTRYGIVQVKVVLAGTKITNVSFVQLTAFDGRSQQINSAAAPTLLQETLSAQSAHIDSVSGATYTSQGYEQSLQSALDKAGR